MQCRMPDAEKTSRPSPAAGARALRPLPPPISADERPMLKVRPEKAAVLPPPIPPPRTNPECHKGDGKFICCFVFYIYFHHRCTQAIQEPKS